MGGHSDRETVSLGKMLKIRRFLLRKVYKALAIMALNDILLGKAAG